MLALPRTVRALVALLLAALLLVAAPLAAQEPPDYAAWESFARKVEDSLDRDHLADSALLELREDVVDWRARFLAAQNTRSTRLATLRDQISTLGPPPAEGATEPPDIAARRAELQKELEAEQAPALRATEAYGRADGIVAQIDRARRSRQASAALRQSPSPLLPSSWAAAVGDGVTLLTGLATDTGEALTSDRDWRGLAPRLSLAVLLLALAVVLLTFGRRWMDRLPARLSARLPAGGARAAQFVLSLGQILLPVAGVWLVARGLDLSGLVGPWGRPFLQAAPVAGLALFTGRWLAWQLLPPDPAQPAVLALGPTARRRARRQAVGLSAAFALHLLLSRPMLPLAGFDPERAPFATIPVVFSEAAAGVWHLPMIVAGAIALFRLGHAMRHPGERAAGEIMPPLDRILGTVANLSRLVAVAAPVATLAGWVAAANAALWPTAMTLAVIGAVILLQRFIADLWLVIKRSPEGARDALAPVLIGFGLVLSALPVLALVWGARLADLVEVWTRLAQGVRIGTVRLSPGAILTFVLVFGIGYATTRGVQGAFRSSILPRTRIDRGGQSAIVSGLGYLGIFLAAVLAIVAAGIDLSSLAIVAGALSVGIGFGLQNVVSNFVSGIILLVERPVTVGDWVRVGGAEGYVRRMSVRATTIQTFDRTSVVVPNSDLITKEVTNWTRGSLSGRVIVKVSVAYGCDTRRVAELLREIAEDQPTVLIEPPPAVLFQGFGTEGLDFEIRAILSDINQGASVASEIRHRVVERFAAEGIATPFQQRNSCLRGPETEAAAPRIAPAGETPAPLPAARRPGSERDNLDPRIAGATTSGLEDGDGDERS